MTVIQADAQMLEAEAGENEWTADILSQTRRMAEMTQRLVYLARLEEQDGSTEKLNFPLSDALQQVCDAFWGIAKEYGTQYSITIVPQIDFRGDEKAIRELMNVLLDNAFKYTPAGDAEHMPLIVYLHGGSGKGSDFNQMTKVDGFPQYLQQGVISPNAYVLMPQLSADQQGWEQVGANLITIIKKGCDIYHVPGYSAGRAGIENCSRYEPWSLGSAFAECGAGGGVDCGPVPRA